MPLAGAYDEVVLLCDSDLEPDYAALQRILEHFGATVRRVALGRVPVDGRITSARHGGWRGHTAGALLHDLGDDDVHTLRLGVRLYFIAMLGPGSAVGFDPALLRRSLRRAARLLAAGGCGPVADVAVHRGRHRYVDPYRLTAAVLGRHGGAPAGDAIRRVFTCA